MDNEFANMFVEESREILEKLRGEIFCLSEGSLGADALKDMYRYAHSLKGISATMGIEEMRGISFQLEVLFNKVMKEELALGSLDPELLDRAAVTIGTLVNDYEKGEAPSVNYKEIEGALSRIVNT